MTSDSPPDPVDWSDVDLQEMGVAYTVIQLLTTGGCSDFCAFKFLLKDVLGERLLEQLRTWEDLMEILINQYDGKALVPELLYAIQRNDVLRRLGLTRAEVASRLERTPCPYLDGYRRMLHDVSEGMTENDLRTLKFLARESLTSGVRSEITCGHGLFAALEKQEIIQRTNLEYLIKILDLARLNVLVRKVRTYADFKILQGPTTTMPPEVPLATENSTPPLSTRPNGAPGCPKYGSSEGDAAALPISSPILSYISNSLTTIRKEIKDVTKLPRAQLEEELKVLLGELKKLELTTHQPAFVQPQYKMDSRPRGICLIIVFDKFRTMNDRRGSVIECDALQKTFHDLGFQVEKPALNCTEEELAKLVDEYAMMDYERYDCFVCCVISHGTSGHVITSDEKRYSFEKIVGKFDGVRCQSLAGKPKLFFVQACEGVIPIYVEQRMLAAYENETEHESIPAMSDFVLSFASFPGTSPFRSGTRGSWYLMALCEVLQECSEQMHLADMLIEVNRRVAEAGADVGEIHYKQCPTPVITLRKALWLRKIDTSTNESCNSSDRIDSSYVHIQ